jgi:hypothetical protein
MIEHAQTPMFAGVVRVQHCSLFALARSDTCALHLFCMRVAIPLALSPTTAGEEIGSRRSGQMGRGPRWPPARPLAASERPIWQPFLKFIDR